MSSEKINLNISGMTCVNCSNGIEKFLNKKKGVLKTKVSFSTNEGEFEINTKIYSKDKLSLDIEKLGYKVEEDFDALEKEQLISFKKLRKIFIISISITIAIFILAFSNLIAENTNKYIIFGLASIVQFYCGARFYKLSYKSVINKNYDMNVLVALGTSAAYFYSTVVVFFPSLFPEHLRFIYFDGAAVIISFVLLGRYLEENSKQKASGFLKKLMTLAPNNANLLLDDNSIQNVLANSLKIEDKVLVKTGEKIPADGVIIDGGADIDTSMISGESLPVFKTVGDEVLSGTLNTNGIITVSVIKESNDTTLSKIINLLKSAQSKQIPISRFADRIANIFVPSVIGISVLTFIVWGFILGDFQSAIIASISVLIISCPCALGLATPIAIVSSVSRGAKEGILIKNPEILEQIKEIKYAVFDKTGTLTKGKIVVSSTDIDKKYFELIASIEKYSEHPISKAIVSYIEKKDFNINQEIKDIEILAGKGIKAIVNGDEVLLGNKKLLDEHNVIIDEKHLDFYTKELEKSNGVILSAINKKTIGSFSLEDTLKEDAVEVIKALKKLDIKPILLTGDNKVTASKIADQLNIDTVYSEVLPTQKYEIIKDLQKESKVMFIGDGINDAPSIKQSDIGITLNSGADISKDAGDIILINNELMSIIRSINLSIETMKIVKQNLFWAFIYNALGIPIAAGILYPFFGIMLTPMYAGIAMSFSSVTVILNSLRLKMKRL
ncbi:heavy metal translocating P-type ATPase [Poseidonibacter lekithochrous]|uniref:heavy metal translocating P-type ATPase n=1 Tax=Poseidonibacter TaxID=2321187 RepID=UPI001C0A38AE|nr:MULTISPECIES: heavy metal translocating P-type ATPase [Poseidonibacter]MBU3015619.1 heavy metal translocating P-type ATPase [Poseidonibacter lekithochrous]MDO6828919.1 heavy metal translocating P-type ATPase [Poseidonibacter sp. 1_MG-2023]